jgi:Rieske Fe-S protein
VQPDSPLEIHVPSNSKSREAAGAAHECDGCPLIDRRGFVRSAGVMALGIVAALGLSTSVGEAMPFLGTTSPIGGRDFEKAYPIPATDGAQIDRDNETIVARTAGKVYVFSLGCPHQNTTLKWEASDRQFACPKHHSHFLADGSYVDGSGRATRGMDRFAVKKDGNTIVADLDVLLQEDDNDGWATAFITV